MEVYSVFRIGAKEVMLKFCNEVHSRKVNKDKGIQTGYVGNYLNKRRINIPCGQINKLLGVALDSTNLTWSPHINNLIITCHNSLVKHEMHGRSQQWYLQNGRT